MREEGESMEGGGVRGEELEERRINTEYEGKRKRLDERGEEGREEKDEKRRKRREGRAGGGTKRQRQQEHRGRRRKRGKMRRKELIG